MPSFETATDIFTRLSVFDRPKGSSNTFKTQKKYQPVFQKKYLIIYKYWVYFTDESCGPSFHTIGPSLL